IHHSRYSARTQKRSDGPHAGPQAQRSGHGLADGQGQQAPAEGIPTAAWVGGLSMDADPAIGTGRGGGGGSVTGWAAAVAPVASKTATWRSPFLTSRSRSGCWTATLTAPHGLSSTAEGADEPFRGGRRPPRPVLRRGEDGQERRAGDLSGIARPWSVLAGGPFRAPCCSTPSSRGSRPPRRRASAARPGGGPATCLPPSRRG